MKILLLLTMTLMISCGRNNRTYQSCRPHQDVIRSCVRSNEYNYGTYYAREMCHEQFPTNRCY